MGGKLTVYSKNSKENMHRRSSLCRAECGLDAGKRACICLRVCVCVCMTVY